MAHRQVRLKDTGELGWSDEAFCVQERGKNIYYSSQEAFRKMEMAKSDWENVIEICYDIMGYNYNMKLPGLLLKYLKEYKDPYGYGMVYETLLSIEQSLTESMRKIDFKSEQGKCHYINKAISNHINDYYQAAQRRKKLEKIQTAQHENIEHEEDTMRPAKRKSKRDVSSFLGDDEWI